MTFYPSDCKPITKHQNRIIYYEELYETEGSWVVGYSDHLDLSRKASFLNLCIPFLNLKKGAEKR